MGKEDNIVMTLLQKRMVKLLDDPAVGDVTRKSLELHLEQPLGQMAAMIVADFKVLADHLVSEVQTCDKCGNEIHFEKYATYPGAKVDLPDSFGGPAISEKVWQFDPEEEL